jgi:hypothetical protein
LTTCPGRIFNNEYVKEGHDIATNVDINSSIYDPLYRFRLEFRNVQLSPQATLLVKIYTIERGTRELVVVGYSALNIFTSRGR